jgi:Asp-tRNA(Asn)/Glu-tRNA(Gln) amidotransferase A subunit family amidase
MTVPCAFSEGLSIGMMLVGKKCDETTILKAARAFEGTEAYAVRPEGAKSASS